MKNYVYFRCYYNGHPESQEDGVLLFQSVSVAAKDESHAYVTGQQTLPLLERERFVFCNDYLHEVGSADPQGATRE